MKTKKTRTYLILATVIVAAILIYPQVIAKKSELNFYATIAYADGTTASTPLSIFHDGKEIVSITVTLKLHLEVKGTIESGTFTGQLITLYDSAQKGVVDLSLPSTHTDNIYTLGSATVDEATLNGWSTTVGSHTLVFETNDNPSLTVTFTDGKVKTKNFNKASVTILLDYQSDSDILIADIIIDVGEEEAPPQTGMTLKKSLIVYGWANLDSSQQANIANNFDLLITDSGMSTSDLEGVKALNPNVQIYSYIDTIGVHPSEVPNSVWATVDSHEDWFMHDNAGNRIVNTYWWGWYLMDVRSGWRDYYIELANSLTSSPGIDGIFGDDVINEIRWTITAGVFSDAVTGEVLTTADVPTSYLDNWKDDMVDFLNYVDAGMTGKFVINSEEQSTNRYITETTVDGKLGEGFGTTSNIISAIDNMARDSATGKIFIAQTNVGWDIYAPFDVSAEFCYAASLLGMNGPQCYYGYNNGEYLGYVQGTSYLPTFADNLGDPTNSYYQNQGVYQRDFTNGKALLNPSDSSYTVDLGQTYYRLDGTAVTTLTLDAWSGEVLVLGG